MLFRSQAGAIVSIIRTATLFRTMAPAWTARCKREKGADTMMAESAAGQLKRACRKLWRRPQDGLCPTPVSHFVNLRETEAEREQRVLLPHRPSARKAEALAQPQHRLVWGI